MLTPTQKKKASRDSYSANPDPKKQASRDSYNTNPDQKKKASRDSYNANPDSKKKASRAASRTSYGANPEPKKKASRANYSANPGNQKRKLLGLAIKKIANKTCSGLKSTTGKTRVDESRHSKSTMPSIGKSFAHKERLGIF